jgi:hypothetical protein
VVATLTEKLLEHENVRCVVIDDEDVSGVVLSASGEAVRRTFGTEQWATSG